MGNNEKPCYIINVKRYRIPEREFNRLSDIAKTKKARDPIVNNALEIFFLKPDFKKYYNPTKSYKQFAINISEGNLENLNMLFIPISAVVSKALEMYFFGEANNKEIKKISDGKYKDITLRIPDELHLKISDYFERRTEFVIKALQNFFLYPDYTNPKRTYSSKNNKINASIPEEIFIKLQNTIAPINDIAIKAIEMFFYPDMYLPDPLDIDNNDP